MISNRSTILSKIVEGFTGKSALLTDDASTIVEKYNNPKLSSSSKSKKTRDFGKGKSVSKESVSEEKVSRPKGKSVKSKSTSVDIDNIKPEVYKKGNLKRFADYLGVKSPSKSDDDYVEELDDLEEMDEYGEYELATDRFGDSPVICINGVDYPDINMYSGGDFLELEFKGEITGKEYESNRDGGECFTTDISIEKVCKEN